MVRSKASHTSFDLTISLILALRRPVFLMALVIFVGTLSYGSSWTFAGSLIIHNGATLSLNNATLDLNCRDLTIEAGGTLDLGVGTVRQCGNLILNTGGILIWGTGTIYYCVDSDGDGLPDDLEGIL
ncbi:MAG: hypothetical protein ACFFCW_29075, partial [Candidatus Hodarchaeota archaeon]